MTAKNVWAVVALVLMDTIAGMLIIAFTAYEVFWLDNSGWWFLLAMIMAGSCTSATYKFANAMMFGIPINEDSESDDE